MELFFKNPCWFSEILLACPINLGINTSLHHSKADFKISTLNASLRKKVRQSNFYLIVIGGIKFKSAFRKNGPTSQKRWGFFNLIFSRLGTAFIQRKRKSIKENTKTKYYVFLSHTMYSKDFSINGVHECNISLKVKLRCI